MHCSLSFFQERRVPKLVLYYQVFQQEVLHQNKITKLKPLKVFLLSILITLLQFIEVINFSFLFEISFSVVAIFILPLNAPLAFFNNLVFYLKLTCSYWRACSGD